jgi:hypothetical protein
MNRLPIIPADERLKETHTAKIVVLGPTGIGKTTLVKGLPAETTLLVDAEAGDLAVQDWLGDVIRPRTWPEFRDLVVFLAGPSPVATAEQPFSQAHFDAVCEKYGDPAQLAKYRYYFVDSITVLGRLCLAWAKTQPQAVSERTGKPDMRGAYGLLGQEMLGALTHLQHTRDKHVVFVAILDEKTDDYGRRLFVPQIEGSKTALELPGIVDEVITYQLIKADDNTLYRAFVTRADNPWQYPAKDRSGRLDLLEPPDLGRLISKITAPRATPSNSAAQGA